MREAAGLSAALRAAWTGPFQEGERQFGSLHGLGRGGMDCQLRKAYI